MTDSRCGKYLTFFLGEEEYGLPILKVREIIRMQPLTRVPLAPMFLLGVINLRGKVVPIVNLRRRFEMPDIEHTSATCIVVVQAAGLEMGLVVDRVSDVLNVGADDVEDLPAFDVRIDTAFLLGLAKTQGRVRMLLDIDRVLSETQINCLADTMARG